LKNQKLEDEDDIMQNHEQIKKVNRDEKPRYYGQNKLFS
jgi:hypothetical protein